jgi:hypothetical protein
MKCSPSLFSISQMDHHPIKQLLELHQSESATRRFAICVCNAVSRLVCAAWPTAWKNKYSVAQIDAHVSRRCICVAICHAHPVCSAPQRSPPPCVRGDAREREYKFLSPHRERDGLFDKKCHYARHIKCNFPAH